MEIKEGHMYKLHGNIVPIYIKVDNIYEIKGFFGNKKMCSVFEGNYKFPRIYKLSNIEDIVISKISEREYKYFINK